ncbi:MAG: gliding motility-associated C-terminal domain-containing protein [Sphingobacteriales bacterium]|nr:gliding motility-associated C-terminal domain-containing protein [Sphingobacteriales bacterium]
MFCAINGIIRFKYYYFLYLVLFCCSSLFQSVQACDNSGFSINGVPTLNPDGTVNVSFTVDIGVWSDGPGGTAGANGNTYGFFFETDVPIVSVSPTTFTNQGTTISSAISGMRVTWGQPFNLSAPIFVDINGSHLTLSATVVLASWPESWFGGGMEAAQGGICNTTLTMCDDAPAGVCYCPCGFSGPNNLQQFEGSFPFPNCGMPPSVTLTMDPSQIACENEPLPLTIQVNGADYVHWTVSNQPGLMSSNTAFLDTPSNSVTNLAHNFTYTITNPTTPYLSSLITVYAINECGASAPQFYNVLVYSSYYNSVQVPLCPGEIYTYQGNQYDLSDVGITQNLNSSAGCDSTVFIIFVEKNAQATVLDTALCAGDFMIVQGEILTPGTYNHAITFTGDGCDSTVIYNISPLPNSNQNFNFTACEGEYYTFMGHNIAAGTSWDTLLTAKNGCDSLIQVAVAEQVAYTQNISLNTCEGENAVYNNIPLSAGNHTFNFQTAAGCYSVVNVMVVEYPADTTIIDTTLCGGGSLWIGGQEIIAGNDATIILKNKNNCDSLLLVKITAASAPTVYIDTTICQGDYIVFNNISIASGNHTFTFSTPEGCDSIVVVQVATLPIHNIQIDTAICNSSLQWYGQTVYTGESASKLFTNSYGCDSTVTLQVSALPNAYGSQTVSACAGDTYEFNGESIAAGTSKIFNLQAVNGCDSIFTLTVAELPNSSVYQELQSCAGQGVWFNGELLNPNSTQTFTLVAANGCDSLLTVFVAELPAYESEQSLSVCEGESVSFQGVELLGGDTQVFPFVASNGCDSLVTVTVVETENLSGTLELATCEGESVSFQGVELFGGDTQVFPFVASNGCDSLVTVTVVETENLSSTLELATCEGESVSFQGVELFGGDTQVFPFVASNGCDSLVTVTVVETENLSGTLELATCEGESVTFQGVELFGGDTQVFPFVASNGCDSLVTVTVVETENLSGTLELATCEGESVTFQGVELSGGDTQVFPFVASNGCDSLVTVTVVETENLSGILELAICEGESVTFQGLELSGGDTQVFPFVASNGCDSLVTVTVVETENLSGTLELATCEGESVTFQGLELSGGDTQVFPFVASNGCDSLVTVTVVETENLSGILELATCEGESVNFQGVELFGGDTQIFPFVASNGCDSLVTVTVVETENLSGTLELTTCEGESVNFQGVELFGGDTQVFPFVASNGCDSLVTVTVVETENLSGTLELTTCEGESVNFQGVELFGGDTQVFPFVASNGCDSLVTVTVVETENLSGILELATCEGKSVTFQGLELFGGDTQVFPFVASNGCDSLVTVTVVETENLSGTLELATCEGKSGTVQGLELFGGDTQVFPFVASNGCDSLVTVTVVETENLSGTLELATCEGESVNFQGVELFGGDTQVFPFVASNGCDSLVTVTVTSFSLAATTIDTSICINDEIFIGNKLYHAGDSDTLYLSTSAACDSLVYIHINAALNVIQYADTAICENTTLLYNNITYQIGDTISVAQGITLQGCDSLTRFRIVALPLPEFDSSVEIPQCFGDNNASISIDVFNGTPPYLYSLNNADWVSSSIFENLTAGTYHLEVEDAQGCRSIADITIEEPEEIWLNIGGDATIQLGETWQFSPQTNASNAVYQWQESPFLSCNDCAAPLVIPTETAEYFLTVSNENGCFTQDSAVVVVHEAVAGQLYVPTAFSPNSDGNNDILLPLVNGAVDLISFSIFDRWGNLMFESNDLTQGWDGTYQEKSCEMEVYIWWIRYSITDETGTPQTLTQQGNVTLIK